MIIEVIICFKMYKMSLFQCMKFTIPYDAKYFKEMQIEHSGSFYKKRKRAFIPYLIVVMIPSLLVLLSNKDIVLKLVCIFIAVVVMCVAAYHWYQLNSQEKLWLNQIDEQNQFMLARGVTTYTVDFTEDYLVIDQKVTNYKVEWAVLKGYYLDDKMMVLYDFQNTPFFYIARKNVSEANFEEILTFIKAKIPNEIQLS